MSIHQHPDYHKGFYDGQSREPIWLDQCTPEYRAGWEAYWQCHRIAVQAAAPLKPARPQRACDHGLFSDDAAQLDLVEMLMEPTND